MKLGYTSAQNGRGGNVRYWRERTLTAALKRFPYAAFVCADGGVLCSACVQDNLERIAASHHDCPDDKQWAVIGADEPLDKQTCDNCGARL